MRYLLAAALLLLSLMIWLAAELIWAPPANAWPVTFYCVAPQYEPGPAHPDTVCGFQANTDTLMGSSERHSGLKEIRLRLVRFDEPGDTLLLTVPAVGREGDTLAFTVDLESGIHGEATTTAVDLAGNEGCIGPHHVFAIPLRETETGLFLELYDNSDLTGFKVAGMVPDVNFDWDLGSPDPTVGPDTFSGRLTGFVMSGITGDHTFIVRVEDGDSLRIGGNTVIRDWAIQEEHERSAVVPMVAGVRQPLQLDFFHNNGDAMLRLDWVQPGEARRAIPPEAFTQ